jgi:iron(III) transport system ATP-binding protein
MPDESRGAAPVARGVTVRDLRVTLSIPVLRGVDLTAEPGSHLAILGPSGCGKTTLLRAIAGLQAVDSGEIWLGDDRVAGPGIHVVPEERRVGLVFQDWALFPHLTVAANVAYGLPRAQRRSRFGRGNSRARETVAGLLEMVGVSELADRLPGSLSGGQQQRVALARALAPRPSVLLFDEPFSSLDTHLRAGVRTEVALLLRELRITSIFVTHDQDEAFVLGDEVAVMREGVIVQQASPAELYSRPVDSWLAEFVGDAELIPGEASGDVASTPIGPVPLADTTRGAVRVLVRPEEIVLVSGADASVVEVEYHGHDTLTWVALADGSVLRSRSTGAPQFGVGDRVCVAHSGIPARAYPAGGSVPVASTTPDRV